VARVRTLAHHPPKFTDTSIPPVGEAGCAGWGTKMLMLMIRLLLAQILDNCIYNGWTLVSI
jgi:hypothetical protein